MGKTLRGRRLGIATALAVLTIVATGGPLSRVVAASPAGPLAHAAVPSGYLIVSADFTAAAGNVGEGSVVCPATPTGVAREPMSGGVFDSSGSLYANLQASYPNGAEWIVEVENQNNASAASFTVYAVCAKPHRAYTQVVSARVAIPVGTQVASHEPCPTGTKVLGGGTVGYIGLDGESISSSYPSSNGWEAIWNNGGPQDGFFYVYAVCSKYGATTGYAVLQGSAVVNPASSQTSVGQSCPSGRSVLGGGVATQDNSDIYSNINSTYPNTGGVGWGNYENNAGSSFGHNVYPYAICAS